MLIMQSNIISKNIQPPIITIRLRHHGSTQRIFGFSRLFAKDVVLGDEVPSTGVQRAGEKGGEDQVVEGLQGAGGNEDVVEEELDADVDDVD